MECNIYISSWGVSPVNRNQPQHLNIHPAIPGIQASSLGWVHTSDICSGDIAAHRSRLRRLMSEYTRATGGSNSAAMSQRQFAVGRPSSTWRQMGPYTCAVSWLSESQFVCDFVLDLMMDPSGFDS